MTEKPNALRLAAALIERHGVESFQGDAAAELRRLHAENEELWKEREEPHKTIEMYVSECNRLERERDVLKAQRDEARRTVREAHEAGTRLTAQRDALLEACKTLVNLPEDWIATLRLLRVAVEQARAAIKAVEENT